MRVFIPFYAVDTSAKVASSVSKDCSLIELNLDDIYDMNGRDLDKSICEENKIILTGDILSQKIAEMRTRVSNTANKINLGKRNYIINEPYSDFNPYDVGIVVTNNINMPPSIIIEDIYHLLSEDRLIMHVGPINTDYEINNDMYLKHEIDVYLDFRNMVTLNTDN